MVSNVVQYSGGTGSWGAAKVIAGREGRDNLFLLFSDVLMEDGDLYRFLIEGACNIYGVPCPMDVLEWWKTIPEYHEDEQARVIALEVLRAEIQSTLPKLLWIAEGRSPWDVYMDERMLGNSRIDPCSRLLKRKLSEDYLKANFNPADTVLHLGIDWTESHRFIDLNQERRGAFYRWLDLGWNMRAPLCEKPMLDKNQVNAWCLSEGIRLPMLTEMGFSHNNCGGACSKAGQGHYAKLLRELPGRFSYAESREEDCRDLLGNVAMMKEVYGKNEEGKPLTRPLPLRVLRERIEAKQPVDKFDIGGCGCFLDEDEAVSVS